MRIRTIRIRNYRSIRDLELHPGPMNAVIGPNNSGKSNILRALNAILGETWPTRPFSDKDLHGYDETVTISVEVLFDQPLECDREVHGFRLSWSPREETEYVAIDARGDMCVWRPGSPKRVNKAMRGEVGLLYLDLERQADRQLRATQWTLYGKLLRKIEEAIPEPRRAGFTRAVTAAVEEHVRGGLNDAQRVIDEFVRRQTGLDVRLDFQLLDPVQMLKGVRPYVIDTEQRFDPEDVGAGVQSALAVAIAKAYAEIVRQPLVLAIEEPELYLHPHGCRHFYRLLRELATAGLQVVYSTHERAFVNASEFREMHLVRKLRGETEVFSGSNLAVQNADRLRIQTKFNDRINEVFFASCVVLAEADPDEIAVRCALERQGFELDRQSISVVSLGGIGDIPVVAQVLTGLEIPTIAVVDEDPGNLGTAATRGAIEGILGRESTLVQVPNLEGLFGLPRKPSRIDAMNVFPAWFGDAGNRTPRVYEDLATRIRALLPP